jgi:hypothetical protein
LFAQGYTISYKVVYLHSVKKKGVLQLTLWLKFLVVKDTCNSLYLYVMNANGQVTWVATHYIYDATHCNSITTLSKQLIFNHYAIPL